MEDQPKPDPAPTAEPAPATMSIDEAKAFLVQQLIAIQHEFARVAQPYVEQLARLEALSPPPPLILTNGAEAMAELARIARASKKH